jgi:hypothetical protein
MTGPIALRQNVVKHNATDFSDIGIRIDVADVWLKQKYAYRIFWKGRTAYYC